MDRYEASTLLIRMFLTDAVPRGWITKDAFTTIPTALIYAKNSYNDFKILAYAALSGLPCKVFSLFPVPGTILTERFSTADFNIGCPQFRPKLPESTRIRSSSLKFWSAIKRQMEPVSASLGLGPRGIYSEKTPKDKDRIRITFLS